MNKHLKAHLSKINFALNRNPQIEKRKNWQKYIPKPYKAVLTISADFELAWASRFTKNANDSYKKTISNAIRARKNIPKILDLCDKYNIPITWATVGHLFLENCKAKDNIPHPEIKRLNHFENKYWKFDRGDWFQHDPCSNFNESPEWYSPDLIKNILLRKAGHEIGCHTFSHIDCHDEICSSEVFNSEIEACKTEAKKFGIQLKSFVHPAHTIGNLDNLVKQGFTSFRTDYRNVLGYPVKHNNGLWEFEQTAEFVYRKEWSIDYHIYRYKKIIDRAIRSNTVCYLWFHPSMDERFTKMILQDIFSYIFYKKDKICITTSSNYINWLKKKTK